MFGNVLVTPSLLDSFKFATTCPPSWKDSAMKDFIGKIRREEVTYPDWVNKGLDFEDTVYAKCREAATPEDITEGSECFQRVARECHGGTFQNKLKKNLVVGNHKAFFFGYSDVEKPDLTIDVKTCKAWKGDQKYLNGSQHYMYLWMNGKNMFKYLVAEWVSEDPTDFRINSVNEVTFAAPSVETLEKEIVRRTQDLFDFIYAENLWEDYYYTFSKN